MQYNVRLLLFTAVVVQAMQVEIDVDQKTDLQNAVALAAEALLIEVRALREQLTQLAAKLDRGAGSG